MAGGSSVSDALGAGFSGAAEGFTVGAITGGVSGYQDASRYNKNPWNGNSTLLELEQARGGRLGNVDTREQIQAIGQELKDRDIYNYRWWWRAW